MLIQEIMRVAVFSPAPPMRPADSSISADEDRASTRATIARITGHRNHEPMARTSPMIADVEVGGGGGYTG